MSPSSELLGTDGPFSRSMKDFAARECQQQMADAVERAIQENDTLIVESGTGTGKTFGYLVPVIANRKKIIVSTYTNHLQDQIVQHDIPLVCRALQVDPQVRILKGRSHYLCRHRFERIARNPELGFEGSATAGIDTVRQRLDYSEHGELAGLLSGLRSRRVLASELSSTADNCLRRQCEWWDDCYVNQARSRARSADILVINHNLLCFDLLAGEGGESRLLPSADVIVVDEAHRLPNVAAESLGVHVSSARFTALCDDFEKLAGEFQLNPSRYGPTIANIGRFAGDLHTHFGNSNHSGPLKDLKDNTDFMNSYHKLLGEVYRLTDLLGEVSGEHAQFEPIQEVTMRLTEDAEALFDGSEDETAEWYEKRKAGVQLHRIPLDPADRFKEMVNESESAWIFTSATLAVGSDFTHYLKRTGLEAGTGKRWDSPFHYLEQSLLYLPPDMPNPGTADYNESVAKVVKSIVTLSRGRAFVLFTSYKALREVQELIADDLDYAIFSQTDSLSRYELLRRFRKKGDAVLLGTSSFWEGVDVKGEALSCVIIDKLPFMTPTDPVLRARIDHMNSIGENPFTEWQVPEAALTLKQGAGRLIRDAEDRGVLVLCDPRVLTKNYGSLFLDSLPPMPRTRDIREVGNFFQGG